MKKNGMGKDEEGERDGTGNGVVGGRQGKGQRGVGRVKVG